MISTTATATAASEHRTATATATCLYSDRLTFSEYSEAVSKAYNRCNDIRRQHIPTTGETQLLYCCYLIDELESFTYTDICIVNRMLQRLRNGEDIRDYYKQLTFDSDVDEITAYSYSYDIVCSYYTNDSPSYSYIYDYDKKLMSNNFYNYIITYFAYCCGADDRDDNETDPEQ